MKELAQEYGFDYDTITADIDEQALGDRTSDPAELVTLLAQAKADAIYERLDSKLGLLLTCDQVVIYQGRVREKPTSTQEVFLRSLGMPDKHYPYHAHHRTYCTPCWPYLVLLSPDYLLTCCNALATPGAAQ